MNNFDTEKLILVSFSAENLDFLNQKVARIKNSKFKIYFQNLHQESNSPKQCTKFCKISQIFTSFTCFRAIQKTV